MNEIHSTDNEELIIDEGTEVIVSTEKVSITERLDTEGESAADYLEGMLDIADLDGDIEIDVENGRAMIEVVTEGEPDRRLKRLVGRNGEVLDALQELTRLAVQQISGERSRLMLDIAGFRANKKKELRELVASVAQQIKDTGESVELEAMNPFERKVCHDAALSMGLHSESEGVEPDRYVVLSPLESDEDLDEDTTEEEVEEIVYVDDHIEEEEDV